MQVGVSTILPLACFADMIGNRNYFFIGFSLGCKEGDFVILAWPCYSSCLTCICVALMESG